MTCSLLGTSGIFSMPYFNKSQTHLQNKVVNVKNLLLYFLRPMLTIFVNDLQFLTY